MGPSPARLVPPPHLTGVPLSTSGELCTTKKDGSWGISSDKWPGSALFHQEITGVVRGTGNMSTFTTSGLAQKGICTPLLLRNTGACGQNGQERLSQNKWLSLDPLCFWGHETLLPPQQIWQGGPIHRKHPSSRNLFESVGLTPSSLSRDIKVARGTSKEEHYRISHPLINLLESSLL